MCGCKVSANSTNVRIETDARNCLMAGKALKSAWSGSFLAALGRTVISLCANGPDSLVCGKTRRTRVWKQTIMLLLNTKISQVLSKMLEI